MGIMTATAGTMATHSESTEDRRGVGGILGPRAMVSSSIGCIVAGKKDHNRNRIERRRGEGGMGAEDVWEVDRGGCESEGDGKGGDQVGDCLGPPVVDLHLR